MPRGVAKKDKKFDSFVTKIAKSHKLSLSGPVKTELDAMIRFMVGEIARNSASVIEHYLKRTKTVKVSTLRSDIESHLKGDLRISAVAAADKAVKDSATLKATKKASKASRAITGAAEEA